MADELCRSNVTRFAASRNAEAEVEDPGDGTFVVRINAGGDSTGARSGEEALKMSEVPATEAGPRVVQITAATMGSGDDELGALLLRSFLKTQAELERNLMRSCSTTTASSCAARARICSTICVGSKPQGSKSSLAAPASISSSSQISCEWAGSPTCSRSPAASPTRGRSSDHDDLFRSRRDLLSEGARRRGGRGSLSQPGCGQPRSRRPPADCGGVLCRRRGA